jgi:hypothetical protein
MTVLEAPPIRIHEDPSLIADYNREKDRVTVEETFAKLVELANSLDAE